jgi:hypothetical protein
MDCWVKFCEKKWLFHKTNLCVEQSYNPPAMRRGSAAAGAPERSEARSVAKAAK